MTSLACFLLGVIAYRWHITQTRSVHISARELIDIAQGAHDRGRESGWDSGYLQRVRDEESLREEGRL